MSKIKGGDMMLFIGGSSIAFATSHTLTINADTANTSNKDEGGGGWSSEEVNLLSWEATTENLMGSGQGNDYDSLVAMMVAKQPVDAVFGQKSSNATEVPTGGWTGTGYSGKVLITSIEINATNGETATFTATFKGVGALNTGAATPGE